MGDSQLEVEILIKQYDLAIATVQYLDSYVPKIFAVYAVFCGLIIANVDKFAGQYLFAALFITISSVITYLVIVRISRLNKSYVDAVLLVEKRLIEIGKIENLNHFFPDLWGKTLSTSRTVRIGIVLLGIATLLSLFA